jgi:hypothetical protein
MKSALQELFDQRLPRPAVSAWAVRLPDHTVLHHCYTDWFSHAQIEQTLTRLALAADGLGRHRIQPVQLCWTFEHARIFLALRSDGSCLALFVENRPGLATDPMNSLLEEFVKLPEV